MDNERIQLPLDLQKYNNVIGPVEGDYYDEIANVFQNVKYHDNNQKIPTQNVYDIRDYGAVNRLDVLSTEPIQLAIKAASITKGTVLVTGGAYRCGTLKLESDVTLFISNDSAIYGSRNPDVYQKALIIGENLSNITFTGGGKICGEGEYFVGLPNMQEKDLYPKLEADWQPPILAKNGLPDFKSVLYLKKLNRARIRGLKMDWPRPGFVHLQQCTNVVFDNFVLESSPEWTLHIQNCNEVSINRLIINDNRHVANADGIDINGSNHVQVKNSFISSSDDGIVIKNISGKAMKGIHISDCEVLSVANCFKIGTETSDDIEDVTVSNCHFFLSDIYPGANSGISIEAADGAQVKNVKIKNIVMHDVMCPIFISSCNRMRFADKPAWSSNVSKVEIEQVVAYNAETPCMITGSSNEVIDTDRMVVHTKADHWTLVEHVVLKDITIVYRESTQDLCTTMACENTLNNKPTIDEKVPEIKLYPTACEYPEHNRLGDVPAYGFYIRHAHNITLDRIFVTPRTTDYRAMYAVTGNTHNISLN